MQLDPNICDTSLERNNCKKALANFPNYLYEYEKLNLQRFHQLMEQMKLVLLESFGLNQGQL